jgi:hypothetical protein
MLGAAGGFGAGRWFTKRGESFRRTNQQTFQERSRAYFEQHRLQTVETVAHLKAQYEGAVYGKVRVWDLIEKLGQVVDPTDSMLLCSSQLIHVQQVLAGMVHDGVTDPDLHLAALLHDLGKVLMLTGAPAEEVFGKLERIGGAPPGAGLDQVVFQFGHPEIIYSRMKDHVPDQVAWLLRYHGTAISGREPFLDERDRRYCERYLLPFREYDLWSKSSAVLPVTDWKRWRALVEERFPNPILF